MTSADACPYPCKKFKMEHCVRAFIIFRIRYAEDVNHSSEEDRYYCLGRVGEGIMTVRFTYRGHVIRIYDAGYWRKGRKLYEIENKIF